MDEDYRDLRGQELDVEVLVGEDWWPGELTAWAKRDGAWLGHCTWRTGVAQQYRGAMPSDQIRLVEGPLPCPHVSSPLPHS
jgi:hypothetical protein